MYWQNALNDVHWSEKWGKACYNKNWMCALPAIHRKFSHLIGPNDSVRYDVTYFPAFYGTKRHFRRSDTWVVHTSIILTINSNIYKYTCGMWNSHLHLKGAVKLQLMTSVYASICSYAHIRWYTLEER